MNTDAPDDREGTPAIDWRSNHPAHLLLDLGNSGIYGGD